MAIETQCPHCKKAVPIAEDQKVAWRALVAKEHGVPAYVVFTDASLRAMAEARPQDLDAFAGIPGVGDRKLAQYGERFTALIRDHSGS